MSRFWRVLGDEHRATLKAKGVENFRRTTAYRYFTQDTYDTPQEIVRFAGECEKRGVVIDIPEAGIGNPVVATYKGVVVSQDVLHALCEAQTLREWLGDVKVERIVEVGAGYGRTAYVLLQRYPGVEYTICDIEPALSTARWYLGQALPGSTVTYLPASCKWKREATLGVCISLLDELTPREINALYRRWWGSGTEYLYIKAQQQYVNRIDGVVMRTEQMLPPEKYYQVLQPPRPAFGIEGGGRFFEMLCRRVPYKKTINE